MTYVRNVTDVDDKINARAAERGEDIRTFTAATLADFHADTAALGLLPASLAPVPGARGGLIEPRATDHIAGMVAMIDRLVEKGHGYVAEGHVLFAVASAPGYGSLSRRSLDEMIAGARVDVAPYKRDPMDFVLWKPSRPGEPAWPSPAGIAVEGRPGWHIECSAMAHAYLGESFDIHGGGIDLVFPHHENERAQTLAAFAGGEMAAVWMHNGFLQVEGQKMSKSDGNFITIRDALSRTSGDVLRLAMLMTHYRQPIDWTERRLDEAAAVLKVWLAAADDAAGADEAVIAALADDLNTPLAIARLSELAKAGGAGVGAGAALLGIDLAALRAARAADDAGRRAALPFDVDALVADRIAARGEKRFADADAIRDRLVAAGVVLMDGRDPDGTLVTKWEFSR